MLLFLASNLEQLDLAPEHISQGDANNARFALMLSDNAAEITLHQLAKNKKNEKNELKLLLTRRRASSTGLLLKMRSAPASTPSSDSQGCSG